MSSMRFNEFADSSAMLLPPQDLPIGYIASNSPYVLAYPPQTAQDSTLAVANFSPSPQFTSKVSTGTNARKRSRSDCDDFQLNYSSVESRRLREDSLGSRRSAEKSRPGRSGPRAAVKSPKQEWTVEPFDVEDTVKIIGDVCNLADAMQRPMLPSRKSQRCDSSLTKDLNPFLQSKLLANEPTPGSADPIVDSFTILLGIGWALLDATNDDLQAAARGWSKYLENHFPLKGVKLLLQSRSLDAFLVSSHQGYFLFKEDLSEGHLVSVHWDTCLRHLQSSPPVFEGTETLTAARTPKIQAASKFLQTAGVFVEDCLRMPASSIGVGETTSSTGSELTTSMDLD